MGFFNQSSRQFDKDTGLLKGWEKVESIHGIGYVPKGKGIGSEHELTEEQYQDLVKQKTSKVDLGSIEQSDEDPKLTRFTKQVSGAFQNIQYENPEVFDIVNKASQFVSGMQTDLEKAASEESNPLDFNQQGKRIVHTLGKSKEFWSDKSIQGGRNIAEKFDVNPAVGAFVGGAAFEALTDIGFTKAFGLAKGIVNQYPPTGNMKLAGIYNEVPTVGNKVNELPSGTMYASTATRADYSRTVTDRSIINNPIKQKEVKLDYLDKKNMKVINIAGEDVLAARTATHHMKGLADSAKPINLHKKGKQILDELKKEGLVLGEHPGNYIAMGETITQASRKFKEKTIFKLYPNIPEKSIKDALRQSIFDKDKWQFTQKELQALEEWRALTLNAPPGSNVKTPKNIRHILNKTGDFPTIELIAKDGSKIKWQPKTFKEYFNRWNKIGEHYGVKIDAKKIKGIKIDPNLDILGKDHGHIHDMLKKLPSNIELNNLIESGKWQKLSVPEAKRVYAAAMNDQYKVAINMAEYRYNKISEYFKKFDPQSRDFARLPLAEQSKYFNDNIEKLVSRGSFKELPDLNYLTKDTNILPGMRTIFGIK